MRSADVVVIGAGVIGTSVAYRLAKQGRKTLLIDRSGIGTQTSAACDKAIFLQSKKPGFHLELAKASRAVYDHLEEELGTAFEFHQDGGMIVIESEEHWEVMEKFVAERRAAGIDVRLLDRKETLEHQPALSPHILGATYSPEDAEVNPLLLSQAFAQAAKREGAHIRTHTAVTGLKTKNNRIVAVETSDGEIATEVVVNAGGPFAPALGEMVGVEIPIRPRRGVIFVSEKVEKKIYGNVLCAQYMNAKHKNNGQNDIPYGLGLSLGQTDAGNLLIGGTREFSHFKKAVSSEIHAAIAWHFARIFPSLADIRMIRTMTGFRPYTGDGLPIVSPTFVEGFIIAAGHEGDGIALSPITGHLVADLLDGGGFYENFFPPLSLERLSNVSTN